MNPALKVKVNKVNNWINLHVAGISPVQLKSFLAAVERYAIANSLSFFNSETMYSFMANPAINVEQLTHDMEGLFNEVLGLFSENEDPKTIAGYYSTETTQGYGKSYVSIQFDVPIDVVQQAISQINEVVCDGLQLPGFTHDGDAVYQYSTCYYNRVQSRRIKQVLAAVDKVCGRNSLEKVEF